MSAADKMAEMVSAGETLRDAAGNTRKLMTTA